MYYIQKTLDVSASHHLTLTYDSKCTRVHGHNWKITVFCKARELDETEWLPTLHISKSLFKIN